MPVRVCTLTNPDPVLPRHSIRVLSPDTTQGTPHNACRWSGTHVLAEWHGVQGRFVPRTPPQGNRDTCASDDNNVVSITTESSHSIRAPTAEWARVCVGCVCVCVCSETILSGITRKSVIQIARHRGYEVRRLRRLRIAHLSVMGVLQRPFYMKNLVARS